ncbi:MAG: SIMPL domain-containing protein, partial [Gemmatimonadota bacterium]
IQNYRAMNNIRVTAGDVEAAGALIDTAIGAGANRVASLGFEVRDREPLRAEALRMAVQKAEAEARTIAEALRVTLGPPLEVRGGAEYQPMYRQEMVLMRSADATPIEAGAQTVSANVTIRYRLGGASR